MVVKKATGTLAPRIEPLRLIDLDDVDVDAAAAQLTAHASHEISRFQDVDVAGRDLAGSTFTECELVGWSANETSFRDARFADTRIDRLNAPVFVAPRVSMRDVVVENSRMGSLEIYDATLNSVVISHSKLDWTNLRASKVTDVLFRECAFAEIDLGGAVLERVAFENCTAEKIDLTGARLKHVDLRGLDVQAIDGLQGLKGATISSSQALLMIGAFAAHLGITIED